MDDSTLLALETALAQSPGNLPLRLTVARAYAARDRWPDAGETLRPVSDSDLRDAADRRFAADVRLRTDDAEGALALVRGEAPEDAILRAKALLALDRRQEARVAYDAAIDANSALEDRELASQFGARVVPIRTADGGERRLRVFANDSTESEEARRLLVPERERVTFAGVGGLESVKEQIRRRIVLPFQKPGLFQKFRKRVGGGILLYGPPGCGKTLLARATAGECSARFLNVAISDVLDMYIGESERKLHALFEEARRQTPAVLFFDEIEALGGKRQYHREATAAKLVSQFLAELDGFSQDNRGVLILGATNVPWAVDPAFRRPGRFDRVVFVPPPDREARLAILRLAFEGRPAEDDLSIEQVARKTTGYSGADLAHIAETAADLAIAESLREGRETRIRASHVLGALAEVKPTTLEWLTTARNYARYANESGQYDEVLEFLRQQGRA